MDNKKKKERLLIQWKHGYDRLDSGAKQAVDSYAKDYMAFLDRSKTERGCVCETIAQAEENGRSFNVAHGDV